MEELAGLTIEQLRELCVQRENDARLAAQFGQSLLLQTQADAKTIHDLTQKAEAASRQMEQLTQKAEQTKTLEIEKLQRRIVELEAKQHHENEDIKALNMKNVLLRDQLLEAARLNKELEERLARRSEDGDKARAQMAEAEKARLKTVALQEEVERGRERLAQAAQVEADLRRVVARLSDDKERLHADVQLAREATKTKEPVARASADGEQQAEHWKAEAAKAKKAAEETAHRLADLEMTNSKLEEGLASLALEVQRLEQRNTETTTFLEESRASITLLRQKMEEEKLSSGGASTSSGTSLLGELEQALGSKLDRIEADKTEKKERPADGAAASQEYFFLAASAVKTAISLKHPDQSRLVFGATIQEAFEKAQRSAVPFHEWYPWLYQYFSNVAKEKSKPEAEKPKPDTRPEITIPPMASAKGPAAKPAAASVGFFGRLARLATEY